MLDYIFGGKTLAHRAPKAHAVSGALELNARRFEDRQTPGY